MTPPFQKISLVVPCFNEEGNIPRIKSELIDYGLSEGWPVEFIFIDDGSSDQTWAGLRKLQTEHPDIKLLQHPDNLGLGMALRTGFEATSGDIILTLDSDLTFHPREIPVLLEAYTGKEGCIMGSPFMGTFASVGWMRRFLSWGVNFLYRLVLGRKLTSTSSIFRLYKTSVIRALRLTSRSFDINAEIVSKMIIKKEAVKEVPVTLAVRQWGRSKINVAREIFNHLKMFVRILGWKFKLSRVS